MKKLFSLMSLAVLALTVGCSEDQTTDLPLSKQGTLRATTEESTRTALNGADVVWSLHDKLAVLTSGAPATIEEYTLISEAGLTTGDFAGNPLTGSGEVYAFYPYTAVTGFADGAFHITIPATQTLETNTLPMVSRNASANELQFKNLMGAVKFQVGGDQTVASITITTAGEKITGRASVAMDYDDAPELVMDASGTNTLTLTEVNTTLTGAPVAFYIALPACEYAAGMKFELRDNNDAVIWSITTSKPLTVTRSMVAALEPVYTKEFPDAKFRAGLIDTYKLVKTADGEDIDITNAENLAKLAKITEFNCSEQQLTSLKGIEYFPALERLFCHTNQLTTLDVSKCTMLNLLECSINQLTALDLSKNAKLDTLSCFTNQLKTLNTSGCSELKWLRCLDNQLSTLNANGCSALELLQCNDNQLTTLDVS